MNTAAIIALALLVVLGLIGMGKGLIKTVFTTFSLIVAIVLAVQVMPYGTKFLKETKLYTTINERIAESINDKMQVSVEGVTGQMDAIENMEIPEFMKDLLKTNNNSEMYEALGISKFTDYISNYITCLVLNGISLLAAFVVIYIILRIIGLCMDMLSKVPVVHGLNRIGGLCLGLINGVGVLWLACIVVTIGSGTTWGQYMFEQIGDSVFLSLVYNNNYLLVLLANMSNILF